MKNYWNFLVKRVCTKRYKEKYPNLTEEEITDVLDSSLLDYAIRVRATFKLLAGAVDELKGGPLDHEL